MERRQSEMGGEAGSGDEDQWKDWEVETSDGSSAFNSDSEEWMDVVSNDDKDLEISDSDSDNHEKIKNGGAKDDGDNDAEPSNMQLDTEVATQVTTLATTKVSDIMRHFSVPFRLNEMFRSLHPLISPRSMNSGSR